MSASCPSEREREENGELVKSFSSSAFDDCGTLRVRFSCGYCRATGHAEARFLQTGGFKRRHTVKCPRCSGKGYRDETYVHGRYSLQYMYLRNGFSCSGT